ncbi:hypothetical protein ZHAS_00019627 [Anopheles sinensis]|uniref:Uncharacterized protein n=1 Tax=Anopheles sinensis TaxID=74873 RepID=A0A084WMW6_ANOSI|nr:hypothetical protein ZHAS_00019627 [Anopheles sinensis]
MVPLVPKYTIVILCFVTGLLPSVIVNLSTSAGKDSKDRDDTFVFDSIPKNSNKLQTSTPGMQLDSSSHSSEPGIAPYQMVAHSGFNDRIVKTQPSSPTVGAERYPSPTEATRTRVTDPFFRRNRHSMAEDEPARMSHPSRYFDSYGEWHQGGEGQQHWQQPHSHQHASWGWPPYNSQQHHGNPLLLGGAFDKQHSLLNLQLLVVLHPFLMLGTVSLIVCLLNAVLGLVDKVKLPLVRTRDDLVSGSSTGASAGLRDGRDEHLMVQLYQFLNFALEQQQQARNETATLGRL